MTPVIPRFASTILLLRDGADGIEVFMMERHHQIEFNSGALVFPGGSVDAQDSEIIAHPELYSSTAEGDAGDLGFRIAAIRETFEESGILLARRRGMTSIVDGTAAGSIEAAHRVALCAHKTSFFSVVRDNELELATDLLVPCARWITPENMPKRFDTWFFLAQAPRDQPGAHDGAESTGSLWLSPREALEGGESGRFKLPFATTRNLIRLAGQPDVSAALEHARGLSIVTVMPVMTKTDRGIHFRIPAEAGYDGVDFDVAGPG
ncbi:MAG: NUDIX domain-containing protein [Alphaproteobacteria bacterium]|nr:NUDIX domain-containing protein [Alphaproteobacteria bacterium]